jgi:hypothetical protein
VFRPQVLGEVCWAALLFICARPTLSKADLLWVSLSICLWANLHGGFLLGLFLLGVMLANQVAQQAVARRSLSGAFDDRNVQRWVLALLLAVAAACVNPSGPKLIEAAITFGNHPNLQDLPEWLPIPPLTTYGSGMLMISLILVLVTLHLSPRRFTLAEVVLLLAFGLEAWFSSRMLPWWMTVWPFVLLPHWRALLDRGTGRQGDKETRRQGDKENRTPSGNATLAPRLLVSLSPCLLVFLGGVALGTLAVSGTGQWLLHRRSRPFEKQFTAETPVLLTSRLKEWIAEGHPMPLRILPSALWSDYLLYHLPPSAQVYWYTHWHCFTRQQYSDGIYLLRQETVPYDWHKLLDLYRINAVALRPDTPMFHWLLQQEGRPDAQWRIIWKEGSSGPETAKDAPRGLVAVRRVDPFVLALAGAQMMQCGVGGIGMMPLASNWSFLTHLPWSWANMRNQVLFPKKS